MFGIDDLLGGLGGAIGSIFGNNAASGNQQAALDAYKKAMQAYEGLNPVDLNTLLNSSQAAPSAMGQVRTDPQLVANQTQAINKLKDVYSSGGMMLGDKVAQQEAMSAANRNSAGQAGALRQEMASRGQLGGGAELAGRMAGLQGNQQASYGAGQQAAATAQQRALQALMESGNLSGSLQGQQFGQEAAKAQAADTMNRFNAQQRAQGYNSNWLQQMGKAGGVAGTASQMGGYQSGEAQRQRKQGQGYGQAIGGAVGGLFGGGFL